jgi:hypothetical protein
MQTLCDDSHGAAAGYATRDVFALGQGKHSPGTATRKRRDPTMTCQNEVNNYVVLADGPANFMQ